MNKASITFCAILLITLLFSAINSSGQPVEIGEGNLIYSFSSWKTVPIQRNLDSLYVILNQYSPDCFMGIPPQSWGDWGQWYDIPVYGEYLEFILANSGEHYYYDNENNEFLCWEYEPYYWMYRDCPGRPVLDSENNIHMIWAGNSDTLFYGLSSDTLITYDVVDTLLNFPRFIRLVSSYDRDLVGAIFYDSENDSTYKYLGSSGEVIDFSSPNGVYYDSFDFDGDEPPAYDMILDANGSLYFVTNLPGGGMGWGEDHIWSEQYGFRYLCDGNDVVMMQIGYEIVFGSSYGEIIVISSENFLYANDSYFYISLDGGDTWYESGFEIDGASGSSTRQYSDSLDFVYSEGDYSYYYPIPRDSILNEMTSISDVDLDVPKSFSLSNYPNPFNASTAISFSLPDRGNAKLAIYDIAGRRVRTLIDDIIDAGGHSVVWNGRNSAGQVVSSGVYFYKLNSEGYTDTKRMLLLK